LLADFIWELAWREGFEPPLADLESAVLPLNERRIWRRAEESNPIPFLRTQFSRLVAAPTQLHYFPKSLVVISGIDPLSLAYEASAHPSTPYHRYNRLRFLFKDIGFEICSLLKEA